MTSEWSRVATFVILGTISSGCSPASRKDEKPTRSVGATIIKSPSVPATPATAADTNTAEQARLSRLEREARRIARTDGCASVAACRTAPVGWRGCGGPRTYVVYCAATTDTVALFRKLDSLLQAEQAYNASTGMMSTCEQRLSPSVALRDRTCRESAARP